MSFYTVSRKGNLNSFFILTRALEDIFIDFRDGEGGGEREDGRGRNEETEIERKREGNISPMP